MSYFGLNKGGFIGNVSLKKWMGLFPPLVSFIVHEQIFTAGIKQTIINFILVFYFC